MNQHAAALAADVPDALDALWQQVAQLTEAGQLRRLSGVFARFVGAMQADGSAASAPLLLACVLLSELEGRGHSCLMLAELAADPCALLGWSEAQWAPLAASAAPLPRHVKGWLTLLAGAGQVWQVGQFDYDQPLVLDGERLYLRRYWRDETTVAAAISARAHAPRPVDSAALHRWLGLLFDDAKADGADSDTDTDWQRLACAIAARGSVAIITGGPGTGKTYTVARLLALLLAGAGAAPLRIALAAPTGKAAARLKQSIDKALYQLAARMADSGAGFDLQAGTERIGAARTLHSLLGAHPDTRLFAHHRANPLELDVLIVDEASMVHLEMMAAILDALPAHATLVLLGDKDQLSSVEAGAVLGDLCEHAEDGGYDSATAAYAIAAAGQALPPRFLGEAGALAQQTVMLRHSHRFGGPIGALAAAVNHGDVALAEQVLRAGDGAGDGNPGAAVAWIEHARQPQLVELAVEGYRPYLQASGGEPLAVLRAFEEFRLLCAVRDGEWGVAGLNAAIEQRLQAARLIRKSGEWYVGRPVMVTRNDYGTRVYNGDIGVTLADPARAGSLRVYFLEGEQVRSVLATRLRHVETAYAMTVHKSQGSEFAHTVMVLPKAGGAMLARELIYTGITRARQRFTLVTPAAGILAEAIVRKTRRASGLRAMLARR
ncbi:exodeoxyribonuclease V subunit alpha [Massilia sp. PWRC2]|uniref:exodeoxyribonuclease V subunit alpha n=1 Tax=Massilia sp. PWRC2 TaxID=2804626 RepID=UPI003CEB0F23